MKDLTVITDLIIIGAGPAGLTAAIYAVRAGISVIVLEKESYGGQIAITSEVENFPSIQKVSGYEFAKNIFDQAKLQGADIRFEAVTAVTLSGRTKVVTTSSNRYEAKAIIIANGAQRRKLNCPGEDEFSGRGVSYCATCDGAFFRKKTVAVIGGGNTALEDALFLSNLCEKVYIIHRKSVFSGEKRLQNAVKARGNIQFIPEYEVDKIRGEQALSHLNIKSTAGESPQSLEVSAVFVAIGLVPENSLFKGQVELDNGGYIVSDESCTTRLTGVFVAGDTRTKELRQIITAASDGAVAAVRAANLINAQE